MALMDNLMAGAPLLLQAPTIATGDIGIDTITNISTVGILWYFMKRTENKNKAVEEELRDSHRDHRQELRTQSQEYKDDLQKRDVLNSDNIEKIVNLFESYKADQETRERELIDKLINNK